MKHHAPPGNRTLVSCRLSPVVHGRAFTLIEVLVVVAIIALLISMLLPSLAAARNQSKITICKANSKQIATMVSEYQAEFQGYVPLLYNYWSNVNGTGDIAERCWLSVALRRYRATTRDLLARGPQFDPKGKWTDATRAEYETKFMPEWYACPFQRGKAPWKPNPVGRSTPQVYYEEYGGRWESYHTWRHNHKERLTTGELVDTGVGAVAKGTVLNEGGAYPQYINKYQTMTFQKNWAPRKWELRGAQAREYISSPSPSEWTVVYCGQGEFTPFANADPLGGGVKTWRSNVGSHPNSGAGGTNLIFADTHVEWVRGTQIGRP